MPALVMRKCSGPSLPEGFSTSRIWRLTASLMASLPGVIARASEAIHGRQSKDWIASSQALASPLPQERSDCEAIRVRGYGLTRDLSPSPVSHLSMRADLSPAG